MRFRLLTTLAFVFASDGVQAKEPRAKPAEHAGQIDLRQRCQKSPVHPQPSLIELETVIADCCQSETPPPEQ